MLETPDRTLFRLVESQVERMPHALALRVGYVDGVHPRRLIEQTQRHAPGPATPTA